MIRKHFTRYAAVLLAMAGITAPTLLNRTGEAKADTSSPIASTVDLGSFDCRTLLKMEGENRNNAILFLHGYVSGQNKQTKIELAPMAESTDRIVDQCINNPSANALGVFTSNRR